MKTPAFDPGAGVAYVIDDDHSVRAALADLLASVDVHAHTFASTREFLAHPRADAPGCLVLDVRMPNQSGLEFQRQMQDLELDLPVIFITGHGDVAMCAQAMKAGAIEFLEKPFRDQDLLDAILHGIERDRANRASRAEIRVLQARWMTLTTGERAVVHLVVQGLMNKQIAGQLGVSEITVKVRRGHAMRKLQVRSLAQLVQLTQKLPLARIFHEQKT